MSRKIVSTEVEEEKNVRWIKKQTVTPTYLRYLRFEKLNIMGLLTTSHE